MVDVDRRTPSHSLALRRLSARASTTPSHPHSHSHSHPHPNPTSPSTSHASGLLSFSPLADSILSHLHSSKTPVLPPLTPSQLHRIESSLSFTFPPDLRALLSKGLPSGPSFPNWLSDPQSLLPSFDLPLASAALQVARGSLWPRSWGPRPKDPNRALRLARAALRRAPVLIPIFDRCYLPASPPIAGNPVFCVEDNRIVCCALDLADFFRRDAAFRGEAEPDFGRHFSSDRRSLDNMAGRSPRWIEFWSDAASDRRRRVSSSSSSSCSSDVASEAPSSPGAEWERFVEIRPAARAPSAPGWVGEYLDGIGAVLRGGGWGEKDVGEMVRASPGEVFDGEEAASAMVDAEAVLDALFVRGERCADALRRAGWGADEFSGDLRFGSAEWRRRERRRPEVKVPAGMAVKMGKIVEAVTRT